MNNTDKKMVIKVIVRMLTVLTTISVGALFTSCGTDEKSQPKQTAVTGCGDAAKSQTPECLASNGEPLSFNNEISAILKANCASAGCHSAASAESGYNYETYAGAKSGIRAGIGSIESGSMPPSGWAAISQADLNKLQAWADQGSIE